MATVSSNIFDSDMINKTSNWWSAKQQWCEAVQTAAPCLPLVCGSWRLEVHVLDAMPIEFLVECARPLHVLFSTDTDVEDFHLFVEYAFASAITPLWAVCGPPLAPLNPPI